VVDESLIDSTHGHGGWVDTILQQICGSHFISFSYTVSDAAVSTACVVDLFAYPFLLFDRQCLVNLLLTGEATAHVFDGEKDAGGLSKCTPSLLCRYFVQWS